MRPKTRPDPALGLVVLLLLINLIAVLGLTRSRKDVRTALREQRALATRADARTFEALLAQQHAELAFLASSPPLAAASAGGLVTDPVRDRWQRLDVEASLLLFLQSHPAVQRLEVLRGWSGLHVVAMRVDGLPQLAPPDTPPPSMRHAWLSTRQSLGVGAETAELRAWLDPAPLLATTDPLVTLHRIEPLAPGVPVESVASEQWSPPFRGWLERREDGAGVMLSVSRLENRYGRTLLLNVALVPLSLILGGLTIRRIRRLARLESEAEQRERVQGLEKQVQHADRLASLGRFAAGIAHEINNPLEGMGNYLQLLGDDLDRGSIAGAQRWVPRLREGIDRTAGTVRQVLSFAEPGRAGNSRVDLGEVITRAVGFLRGHPDSQDASIEIRIDQETEPLWVIGDAQTLGQVILNLVLNSCQVQLGTLPDVEVHARREGGRVVVLVLDRGPGFDPELKERLFEPFQSGRGSIGLGLAVCQSIVLGHGGHITATNRDNGGACVRVDLPASARQVSS